MKWLALLLVASPCLAQEPVISLREYIDIRIDAVEQARGIAYQSMEKRLEGMNEFRATLKDQTASFVTRSEFDRALDDIRILREKSATGEGKASQSSMFVAVGFSVAGLLVAVATFIYRKGV